MRDRLAADGISSYPKTSGKKGMQLCCPIAGTQDSDFVSGYAKRIAQELERAHPKLIVSKMAKNLRPGKVFIDWSQNNAAKTTVAPYSLRAQAVPSASTPLTWDEVAAGAAGKRPRHPPLHGRRGAPAGGEVRRPARPAARRRPRTPRPLTPSAAPVSAPPRLPPGLVRVRPTPALFGPESFRCMSAVLGIVVG